jgi:peroxiredoxin/outer membrane lipoprotein-sorting protein
MYRNFFLSHAAFIVLWLPSFSCIQSASAIAEEQTKGTAAEFEIRTGQFRDQPADHALYNQVIEAMRKAKSLSFTSHLKWEKQDRSWQGDCIYRAWLKKPNYFRIETEVVSSKKSAAPEKGGILIGDGDTQWIYWPQGRSQWPFDDPEVYKKTRLTSYMRKPAPLGEHSIGHDIRRLIDGMSWTVLDLSMFHGHIDALLPNVEGVKALETEKIGEDDCDNIEVDIRQYQRTWYLWLSKRDHLPRKLKDIRRVSPEIVVTEDWSSVALNADMPETLFAWKPPQGWTEWRIPDADELLRRKPGTKATDFELACLDGTTIKLSKFRGQVVWLCFWYAGCPPCREELPRLQQIYTRYKDKGLVVLGFNCVDDKKLVSEFLAEKGMTFPMIVDTSADARNAAYLGYQPMGREVYPLNYIIDHDGRIVRAWSGNDSSDAIESLQTLGGELGEAIRRYQDANGAKTGK